MKPNEKTSVEEPEKRRTEEEEDTRRARLTANREYEALLLLERRKGQRVFEKRESTSTVCCRELTLLMDEKSVEMKGNVGE